MSKQPNSFFDIPRFTSDETFDKWREIADTKNLNHCPCCGKPIPNPKYFIRSIFGGCMYAKTDLNNYSDAWVMAIGSECRKKIPAEFVMSREEMESLDKI